MTMIKPTVGRVVWFIRSSNSAEGGFVASDPNQPCAAIVAYVWTDRMVNLNVIDHNGKNHSRTSVPLIQEGDAIPEHGFYASWMPYQVGQAKAQAAA